MFLKQPTFSDLLGKNILIMKLAGYISNNNNYVMLKIS